MFDIAEEVKRLQQLQHTKIHGLPYKPKIKNPEVEPINGTIYNGQAAKEGNAISRCFKSRTMDFGRRLRKVKGQKHFPGGYAGYNLKGA